MPLKIYNCEQGSIEWHSLRCGKITASHAQAVATAGKGLNTYINQIVYAQFTGKQPKIFRSQAMTNGNELEYLARIAYEMQFDCSVAQIGFGEFDERVGASPDGLVGEDGGIEIKTRESDNDTYSEIHGDLVLGEVGFESKYIWQCHMNMLVFDRQWWDLISFDPSFKSKSLFVKRIFRDIDADNKLLAGFKKGKELIELKSLILMA